MIRVVIDTNIVISALLRAGSLPEAAINLAFSGDVQWVASEAILAEYAEVLQRPRFAIGSARTADVMSRIRKSVLLVAPTIRIEATKDPDDNMFWNAHRRATRIILSPATSGIFLESGRKLGS